MSFIRGINPIWSFVDLQGLQLDDTYYLFTLYNIIPYLPQPIYQDAESTTTWSDPIQFLANGTLPDNMYWNPDTVYRLEVRQGPTQDFPLIYVINNYVADSTGGNTPSGSSITTDNQITNPQFTKVSFSPNTPINNPISYQTTASSFEVAPGWILSGEALGAGSMTVRQVPILGQEGNPTNAPYGLVISSTGWQTITLTQVFSQNGSLWSGQAVSMSVTAYSSPTGLVLNSLLVDSNLQSSRIIVNASLGSEYNEQLGSNTIEFSTSTDTPPEAFTSVQLTWQGGTTIGIASIQLLGQVEAIDIGYAQTTVERQKDQTYHIYADSILTQPKESLAVGWDFGLNPWQTWPIVGQNLPINTYTADQTVVIQKAYVSNATPYNVFISRASAANNFGFKVSAVTATNQFAIINYIDPASIGPYWGYKLSSLLKATLSTTHATKVGMKMRLIWRTTLPSPVSQTEPISSWTDVDPVFSGGWIAIAPKNDPVYQLGSTISPSAFEGMQLPTATTSTQTLAIVLYTTGAINNASTADFIVINDCSLVVNDFAIASSVLSWDETLRRCQYYCESSYNFGNIPGDVVNYYMTDLVLSAFTGTFPNIVVHGYASSFSGNYREKKRSVPSLVMYSPDSATQNRIQYVIKATSGGPGITPGVGTTSTTNWTVSSSTNGFILNAFQTLLEIGNASGGTQLSNDARISAVVNYNFLANSRLGV